MKTMGKIILVIVVMVILSCNRESDISYLTFDANNDGTIKRMEFVKVFSDNYYNDWNTNDDEYLDDEDFSHAVFNIWDKDDDTMLAKEEWLVGYDYYYGDYVLESYDVLDLDGDGSIDYHEYENALGDTDFFISWDADADDNLSEEELAFGVFNYWDLDKNGELSVEEFNEFKDYYL